jgi:hypothetical protein
MADACKGHGLFEDELYTGDRRVSSGACACTAIIANDGFCGLRVLANQTGIGPV